MIIAISAALKRDILRTLMRASPEESVSPKQIERTLLMKHFTLRIKLILVLTAVASLITATALARKGKQDFILHNQTGVEIHSLYVSPHSADDWQEDVLGRETLPSGETVKITFNDRDKHVHWDLKVTDKDGNALEWYDLNLVEIEEVTLHWDAAKGKGWADIK